MNLKLKHLIFKYELLRRECFESEKFSEARILTDFLTDLKKLQEQQDER